MIKCLFDDDSMMLVMVVMVEGTADSWREYIYNLIYVLHGAPCYSLMYAEYR